MTRKHFERIAQVFRVNAPDVSDALLDDMCVELKAINPRFNAATFRAACKGE